MNAPMHLAWYLGYPEQYAKYGYPACRTPITTLITTVYDQVTCLRCLEVIAEEVEKVLDQCMLHGATKNREACDVCMGRGAWGGLAE